MHNYSRNLRRLKMGSRRILSKAESTFIVKNKFYDVCTYCIFHLDLYVIHGNGRFFVLYIA